MKNFTYVAARSLDDALTALDRYRSQVALLAGGTDLIVGMRANLLRPEIVVDIKRIPELQRIEQYADGVSVGAGVSCRRIYRDADLMRRHPILGDSTRLIGSVQIQGRATMGGNLCNAAPSGDTIPTLFVLAAQCEVIGSHGRRLIPVETFCIGPRRSVLGSDELLVGLRMPRPAAVSGASFLRFTPRNEMDIAVANAAATVELSESRNEFVAARIAIGSVAPTVLLLEAAGQYLAGKPATEEHIRVAAEMGAAMAQPIDDMRGTVEQRRMLSAVLIQRVLRKSIARARGITP